MVFLDLLRGLEPGASDGRRLWDRRGRKVGSLALIVGSTGPVVGSTLSASTLLSVDCWDRVARACRRAPFSYRRPLESRDFSFGSGVSSYDHTLHPGKGEGREAR